MIIYIRFNKVQVLNCLSFSSTRKRHQQSSIGSTIQTCHFKQAMQNSAQSSVEDPLLSRDLVSQNQQPRTITASSDYHKHINNKAWKTKMTRRGFHLLIAGRTIVIFMPEAVHRGAKKANTKHHRHHTSNNSCQTWFWSNSLLQVKHEMSLLI